MNPMILNGAIERLMADFAFNKHKNGKWLQEGKCPSCHQKELFASAEAPWVIKCGRLNHCSYEGSLRELYPDLFNSWSDRFKADDSKGIVALAYWLGSYFAEQIRQHQQSYPFLEIVGEPGAGKTTLIEFLWKLSGRTGYEGFDPSKSTLSGRSRNMTQVSNLPIVLMEGDRDEDSKAKKFDFDELKPLYNGRSPRAVGVKSSGNETYEPPFRGAMVIAQTARVFLKPCSENDLMPHEH